MPSVGCLAGHSPQVMSKLYSILNRYVCMCCTVLRAVGIPARPITNYDSAHDTEANKTIDYYYDKDWNIIEDKSADSIWYVCTVYIIY